MKKILLLLLALTIGFCTLQLSAQDTTQCGLITVTDNTPWVDDFSNEPECWEFSNNGWEWDEDEEYLHLLFGSSQCDAITPIIDITNVSTPYLKFSQKRPEYLSSGISDDLEIYIRSISANSDTTWRLLESFTNVDNNWVTDSIPLPRGFSTIQIKFHGIGNGYDADGSYIDSVCIYNEENAPTCIAPISLSVSNIETISADLTWLLVYEGSVDLYYKASSDNSYTLIPDVILSDGIYTLYNLTSTTLYEWYLVMNCTGDTAQSAIFSFTTACEPLTLPYIEGFEFVNTSENPICWNTINNHLSCPSVNNTYANTGSHNYKFYNDYINNTPQYAILPEFDAEFSELQISFWTRREGEGSGTLSIGYITDLEDTSTFVPLMSVNSTQIGDNNYHNYAIAFDTVVTDDNTHYFISFKYECSSNWFWFIDDINVTLISQCIAPDSLLATNITSTSADLSWTGESYTYTLYYKEANETEYTAIENITLNANGIYTLENLYASTNYNWYVAANCNDGPIAVSQTIGNFNTSCSEISSVPVYWNMEENLNAGTSAYPLPICWSRIGTGPNAQFPYTYNHNAYTGNHCLYFYNHYANSYAVLPVLDTNALSLANLQLSMYAKTSFANTATTIEVGVMTDPNDTSTFTTIASYCPTTTYTLYETPFLNYTGSGNYIAIRNISPATGIYSYFYIDDITLESTSSCSRPLSLTATPNSNSAILSWISAGSTFTLYYKEASENTWQTITNVTLDNNNEYNLTGLLAGTTYDWYVETACGMGTELESDIAHFTTMMIATGLPYQTNFATDQNWLMNNSNAPNYWVMGIPSGSTTPALFITNNGTSAGYATDAVSIAIAEKNFTMPANDSIHVMFDVQVGGEGGYIPSDYLKVFLAPATVEFTSGATSSNTQSGYDYTINAFNFSEYIWQTDETYHPYKLCLTQDTIIHIDMDVINPDPNGSAKLVFLWRNDSYLGTQPGAIISNFSISESGTPTTCDVPTNITSSNLTYNSADISWTAGGNEAAWNIQYKEVSATNWSNIIPVITPNYIITGLTANTAYDVRIQADCGENTSEWTTTYSFTTLNEDVEPCDAPTNLSITDISATSATISWTPGGNENAWNLQYRLASVASDEWSELIHVTNTPSYTITDLAASTAYQVRVQADCGDNNLSYFISDGFTTEVGIHDMELTSRISLQPNPADKYIELNINSTMEMTEAMVYNAFGQLIQTVQLTDNHARIDLSNMAAGMYFVRVNGDKVTATKKFIRK